MARPLPIRPQLLHPPPDESESVPFTISGLIGAWFADDLRASLADAAAVSSWADASGNGNTLSNTGTNRPTFNYTNPQFNGHASVNFVKASTQSLYGTSLPIATALSGSDKPYTIFAVVRRSTKISADEYVWTLGNTSQPSQSYASGGYRYQSSNSQRVNSDFRDDAGTAATNSTGTNEITDLSAQVLCWSMSGTIASIYVAGGSQNPLYDALANTNGTASDYSAQGTITFDQFSIGGQRRSTTVSRPCDLEVACVLVYNRELNEADRVRLVEHLWNQYVPRVIATPNAIPNLTHWWDASQLAGAEASDVTAWNDLIGAFHFDSTGFGDHPVIALHDNGNKVVSFTAASSQGMDTAGATDGNFLHNNSAYSLFVVYRTSATALTPILTTMGDSTTAQGFTLAHDGASSAHSLQVKIGNGATNVINHDSQDYGSRPGVWHVAHITHEASMPSTEEEYQVWIDNENYAGINHTNAEDSDNAAGTITLGRFVGGAYGTVEIAEIIVYDRKLGRPNESKLVNEYLARKWQTPHAALAAGNGLANFVNDTNKHRGFPALCQDVNGTWHCVYRRGPDHGASRGVGTQVTSADGICWSPEKVIYNVDDADGRDFRGECGFIRLTQGTHAGRLLLFSKWSTDASAIEVTGFPSTLLIGYSDDNGGSWTWLDPMASDPIVTSTTTQLPVKYTASPNGLIELSTGRIVMTFSASDKDEAGTSNQDIRLSYSDDGGLTWSDSVVVLSHDSIAWRATETHILEWDDGALTMFVRNDTDKEIWRLTATISDLTSWSLDGAKLFDGYGRPMAIRDPNDAESCYIIYRSDPGVVTVWRHSADRGATWAAERAFSNLHSTTTIAAHGEMSYSYAAADADGNIWVASGLEEQDDSDIFVRRWIHAD